MVDVRPIMTGVIITVDVAAMPPSGALATISTTTDSQRRPVSKRPVSHGGFRANILATRGLPAISVVAGMSQSPRS
jgi:hypothetical protein